MTTGLFTSLPGLSVQPAKTDPNPLVIYHGKCPDGFGAALAAWLYFEGQGEYLGVSHGKVTSLAIDFVQYSEGNKAKPLVGMLRYNSSFK